jgi:hypothetical protein
VPDDLLGVVDRYAVLGQPGHVRVAQVVEAQAGATVAGDVLDRFPLGRELDPAFDTAVVPHGEEPVFPSCDDLAEQPGPHQRRPPHPVAEQPTTQRASGPVGEHLTGRARGDRFGVRAEQLDGEAGQGDHPSSGPGLGVGLHLDVAGDLGGGTDDVGLGVVEVEGVPSQSDRLSPAQAGAAAHPDKGPVPVGHGGEQVPAVGLPGDDSFVGVLPPYVLNYQIINADGPTVASTVTYLLPVVAIVLGLVFLDEPFGWNLAIGTLTVLAGVVLVRQRPATSPPYRWGDEQAEGHVRDRSRQDRPSP